MPLEAAWRSCSSVEGHSSSSSHVKLGGSPQLRSTSRKPVGLDMPNYKYLCQILCSDFPRGVAAALSCRSVAKWLFFSFQTHMRRVKSTDFAPCSDTGMPDWSQRTHLYTDLCLSNRDMARARVCTHTDTATGLAFLSFL